MNDLSDEGIAMNINSVPGQMCRCFGEMRKFPSSVGGMRNSHQSASMYSCS